MQPDEVLRLDNARCIVLLRSQLPMLLYKVTPPEFPDFRKLRPVSIADYTGAAADEGPPEKAAPEPVRREYCPAPPPPCAQALLRHEDLEEDAASGYLRLDDEEIDAINRRFYDKEGG